MAGVQPLIRTQVIVQEVLKVDPREFRHGKPVETGASAKTGPQAEYRVTWTLAVQDLDALWSAAAAKGMAAPQATIEDVLDVIGPREDPSISECIAMLAAPVPIPGCLVDDFWIDSIPNLPTHEMLPG